MEYLVLGLIAILIVVLLVLLGNRQPNTQSGRLPPTAHKPKTKPCPLCRAPLQSGQRLKSRLITLKSNAKYPAPVKESISHVLGCPYCWPDNRQYARVCPVCQATLSPNDYVIGRFFEKTNAKNHLHILGCSRCRP